MKENVIYVDFKSGKRIAAAESGQEAPSPPPRQSDRKTAFLELMNSGMVRTVVNGTYPGVTLPDSVRTPATHLNWSYKFDVPDLIIDDFGIKGTLSFQQAPTYVTIPWESIISIWNLGNPKDSRIDWS